jgi:hypothetical protein
VVIKLRVAGAAYYLMRANAKWKDINFIGGHDKPRDARDLETTARRELWEEVPSIRGYGRLEFEPLTSVMNYGPILSRSKGDRVEYEIQFFLLKINRSPASFVELLSSRTRNIWISEEELTHPKQFKVSGLVTLLDQALPGGIRSIPFSSATDMDQWRQHFERRNDAGQLQFALK